METMSLQRKASKKSTKELDPCPTKGTATHCSVERFFSTRSTFGAKYYALCTAKRFFLHAVLILFCLVDTSVHLMY